MHRTPVRYDDDPSHPSDSFQSPVLGESASTCRPPGRPLVSDSDDSDQSDVDDREVNGQPSAAAPSLLYKDKNQFYANFLVRYNFIEFVKIKFEEIEW